MPTTVAPHEPATTPTDAQLPVVPLRHWGRFTVGALVLAVSVWFLLAVGRNPNLDWPTVGEYLFAPLTFRGLFVTVWLTFAGMVMGIVGGTVVAVMRLSSNPVLRVVAGVYIWAFRGTPILIQIIFWGFLGAFIPTISVTVPFTDVVLFSAPTSQLVPATVAALLALGLNEVAYAAEIVRAGIQSIDKGQTEAAKSLGLTPAQTLRRVVLPQAMRVIVPPMGNETLTMLKTTALVSVIAGQDLMSNLQAVYAQNFKVIPLLIVASIWFLVLTTLLTVPQRWLEQRFGRGVDPGATRRPLSRALMPRRTR
ncbi:MULTISPECIES: amino acid ABC transporter permease [Isoptericola]|uniref:Amino acid ABC transporter permease n=1 Tax=Isoptericola sediminis TaxID=2733572 RepID=A0A849JWY5_9MICO|nr:MULTISPECIES: amino acid ABC transporter permease [Isoptericola]MDO8144210.1 amino acid ABC transporter permease [Isoptericola sp. 178]NNU27826.1 amino acid ABC transporter permease [Isoptericola sediminis]